MTAKQMSNGPDRRADHCKVVARGTHIDVPRPVVCRADASGPVWQMACSCYIHLAVALLAALILLATPTASLAGQPEIQASVDKHTLYIDDTVTLTISVSGTDAEPRLPDLSDDFSIVSQVSSKSVTIINMQIETSTTYRYVLQPERTGKLVIPPITLKTGGNTYQTRPITIEVLGTVPRSAPGRARPKRVPAVPQQPGLSQPEYSGDKNLFCTMSVDKDNVFLGEQLTLTFRLFTRYELASADYTPAECTNFWKEEIEQKNSYITVFNQRRYRVQEIKTALFPTKTGVLTIGRASVRCSVDRFFSPGFFFGHGLERPVTLRTQPLKVRVKPLPQGAPPGFAGTVGQFSIDAKVDRDRTRLGKPITLTVKVWGTGNVKTISAVMMPQVSGFEVYEPNVKEYVDRSKSPIRGSKTFEYVMVPKRAGRLQIPPVTFSYFDPVAARYRTVTTKPIEIEVTGQPTKATAQQPGIALPDKKGVAPIAADIRYIKPRMTSFSDWSQDIYNRSWVLILLLAPAALALALWARRIVVERLLVRTGLAQMRSARKRARQGLAKAKARMQPQSSREFYSLVARSLVDYLAERYNVPSPSVSASTVESLVGDCSDGKRAARLASECLATCDFYRFSAQESTLEEMKTVWSKAAEAILLLDKLRPSKKEAQA